MTSEEIRKSLSEWAARHLTTEYPNAEEVALANIGAWLSEIAYQLAVFNEGRSDRRLRLKAETKAMAFEETIEAMRTLLEDLDEEAEEIEMREIEEEENERAQ